ncbi:LamG domain-containing protein [Rhizobium cauense]|uniref:LamG domain-containing protein n=1 Tax=Rhizobium cauense TaxID=1166683 RepID=UPI001C6DE1DB|nr:LamG domain-containing protein [Rhizobium cauense]MBW9113164.1 LamG domain-containing protein [Rhizobium cauense]
MAAILPSSYKEGTVSVANGSTAVTGTNTFWGNPNGEGNPILPGDWFGVHKGVAIRIASIEGNGALTLANPWPGPTQVDAAYEVMLQSDNARMAMSTRQLLQQLMNGNIAAFTGLNGEPDTVPYFTGPGDMGLLTRQDLTQGVSYDVQVDTLTDRAAYDLQIPGYAVFVSDVGDGRAAIYSKVTAASGDWSDPAYITGPQGLVWRGTWNNATNYSQDDAVSYNGASYIALVGNTNVAPAVGATWGVLATRGATGLTGVNPRGNYDNATAYAATDAVLYNGSSFVAVAPTTGNPPPTLPATSNTWWQLLAQKGQDGTGTGDVVGPAGATDGAIAAYNGTTGKLIKALTPSQVKTLLAYTALDVSFDNSVANLAGAPGSVQAAINALASNGGKNDALFAIEIADLKGQRMGMVGGVADSFDDTTGIYDGAPASNVYGLDNYAYALLHFDGAAGSRYFQDSGVRPRAWLGAGDAQIGTGQSKFGGASLLLDGAGDYLFTVDNLSEFAFGTGDFTIDFWVRIAVTQTTQNCIFYESRNAANPGNPAIYLNGAQNMVFLTSGINRITSTTALVAGTWYHIAVSRVSGTTRMFVNGVKEGVDYVDGGNYVAPPTAIWIGCDYTGAGNPNGNIEEYRISKIGRYAANFTPAAVPYSVDPAGSFGYTYDAVNDCFSPAVTGVVWGTVNPVGAAPWPSQGYTVVNRDVSLGPGLTIQKIGYYSTVACTGKLKLVQADSTTQYDILYDVAFVHPGNGWLDVTLPVPFTLPSTAPILYMAAFVSAVPGGSTAPAGAAQMAYKIGDQSVGNDNAGFTLAAAGAGVFPLRVSYLQATQNMTLVSAAYPAGAVPSSGRIALQLADSLTLTPGTDFTVEVSRDGGTTWTAVTMSLTLPAFAGVKMYEGQTSLTGQPSGSSMKWRLKTLTNKAIIASGVVLQQL